jgi:hypothetical protein
MLTVGVEVPVEAVSCALTEVGERGRKEGRKEGRKFITRHGPRRRKEEVSVVVVDVADGFSRFTRSTAASLCHRDIWFRRLLRLRE